MIYLIYNKEEIEINQFSINKYIEGFNKYGIKCQLMMIIKMQQNCHVQL